MTIRLRLTLLFVALLAAIGAIQCIGVLSAASYTLERMAQTDARDKVHQIRDYLHDLDAEVRHSGRGFPLELASFDALPRAFSDDGSYLQLTDTNGNVLNKSPNMGSQRLPASTRAGVQVVELPLPHLTGSRRVMIATQALELEGRGVSGWVQAAYPLQGNERIMRQLVTLEVAGWLMAALFAFAVGYLFAGRALRPVAEMTEEVQGMRSTDLNRRLATRKPPQDELDRLAGTFNSLFERLELAFAAKQRFVADASHELRSPLTAILGHLQLIRRRGVAHPEDVPAWADAAEREAHRLTRLVESLLELARVGEGQLMSSRLPVDLAALAQDVTARYHVVAPRVACQVTTGPAFVMGDADRLKQVLINLVDNALRATREGGGVTLDTAIVGERVIVRVKDTGEGIPATEHTRIFDRFYRIDGARDRANGGTGLGLAITLEIVEAHGGQLEVQSVVGQGSTFTMSLPASA